MFGYVRADKPNLYIKDDNLKIQVDIRYPATFSEKDVDAIIKNIGIFQPINFG